MGFTSGTSDFKTIKEFKTLSDVKMSALFAKPEFVKISDIKMTKMHTRNFADLTFKFKTLKKADVGDQVNFFLGTKVRVSLPQEFYKSFMVVKPTHYKFGQSSKTNVRYALPLSSILGTTVEFTISGGLLYDTEYEVMIEKIL